MSGVLYRTGLNRIFYSTRNFDTGVTVTCFFWSPELKKSGPFTFAEVEMGLYFFDHEFQMPGTHAGTFFEDGVQTISSEFRVLSSHGNWVYTGDYRQ